MNPSASSSTDVTLPFEVQVLLESATRLETQSCSGPLVWHVWGLEGCNRALAPLVLLHGGSGSWTHWLRNIRALVAAGRCVYIPDLPGFGDSAAPPKGSDADALTEPVEQGLGQLLGNRACDLVGFSFGGMVAGFIAAQFPARTARLVLVGAPGLGIAPGAPIGLRGWRHLPEAAEREAVHRSNLATLMLYRPEAITGLALQLHQANVVRDRMQRRRLSRTDILARALARVQCPVDAIYGGEDAFYRGKLIELESVLRQGKNLASFVAISATGHWVQFEQPEAFNAALLAALGAAPHAAV